MTKMLRMPSADAPSRSDCSAMRLRSRQVICITGSIPAASAARLPAQLASRTFETCLSVTLTASTQSRSRAAAWVIDSVLAPRGGLISAVSAKPPAASRWRRLTRERSFDRLDWSPYYRRSQARLKQTPAATSLPTGPWCGHTKDRPPGAVRVASGGSPRHRVASLDPVAVRVEGRAQVDGGRGELTAHVDPVRAGAGVPPGKHPPARVTDVGQAHVPLAINDPGSLQSFAYCYGYIRGLIQS